MELGLAAVRELFKERQSEAHAIHKYVATEQQLTEGEAVVLAESIAKLDPKKFPFSAIKDVLDETGIGHEFIPLVLPKIQKGELTLAELKVQVQSMRNSLS